MSGDLIRLTSPEVFVEPFPYSTSVEGLGEVISSALLEWLEIEAPWKLAEKDSTNSTSSVSSTPRYKHLVVYGSRA